jgi:hypothetical protein
MRDDDDIDALLHEQGGNDVLFKLTLGRIGALALGDDDGDAATHEQILRN